MEPRDLVVDALGRVRENMHHCLDGLTPDQLVYRPEEHANSIAWLAWHLTRVQDGHVSDLAGQQQAWIAAAWHARFDKPANPHDSGFGHTPEQVAAIRPSSAQLLLDYYDAVYERSVAYLQTVSGADMDRVLDEPQWATPVTVGMRLVSVIGDCMQHIGQMAYIRGLIERRHWIGY